MGARPMARVIQTQIKTPLADEVLFGRLKNGGVVRVVVTGDDKGEKKLGFVYPEGPGAAAAGARTGGRQPRARQGRQGASRSASPTPSTDPDDDAPEEKTPSEPQVI